MEAVKWSCPRGHKILCSPYAKFVGKRKCPRCKETAGEKECRRALERLNIDYIPQYAIASLPYKKFDFAFLHHGVMHFLEFDGPQHFSFNAFFHKTIPKFELHQLVDRVKNFLAIRDGVIIRIAYLQNSQDIQPFLSDVLAARYPLGKEILSHPGLYEYLHQPITDDDIARAKKGRQYGK